MYARMHHKHERNELCCTAFFASSPALVPFFVAPFFWCTGFSDSASVHVGWAIGAFTEVSIECHPMETPKDTM